MDSSSIIQYIAELEKSNSELLKANSELKEDQKRIVQLRKILGGNNESRPAESEEIENDELFDLYIRTHGPAANLSSDEKFMSYHVSDMLYWLSEKEVDQKRREAYDKAAGAIYNLNHEIFSGEEAFEIFKRGGYEDLSAIDEVIPDFCRSVAQKIDKYLKMPKM